MLDRRRTEEAVFKVLMITATAIVAGSLFALFIVIIIKGAGTLNIELITQLPKGGYYSGESSGGIANAIVGSLYLALGATVLSIILALPAALFLQKEYVKHSSVARLLRIAMNVSWGIPSIVYGAFGFIVMLYLGIKACLLGGLIALTLLELPIMITAMDSVISMVPNELKETSYAMGATRLETVMHVICKQTLPGLLNAVLLAFGRGIGDAASILFTAGYTDRFPQSLFDPVASLPLSVFFLIGTPFPEVQQRAYAAALILLVLVLSLSITSRLLTRRFSKYVVR